MSYKYSWSRKYSVDPQVVGEIIESMPESTASNLIKEARKKRSPLHSIFEWDDTEAAREYRLMQARMLIRSLQVEVINSKQEPEQVVAFVKDINQHGGYVPVFEADPESISSAESDCYKQMVSFKRKWKSLELARTVCDAINDIDRSMKRKNVS